MTKDTPPLIVGDFGDGADGPTILLATSGAEGVELLRSLFENLSTSRPGTVVHFGSDSMISLTSELSLELRVAAEKCKPHLAQLDSGSFAWTGTPYEWETLGLLIEPLLRGAGHQYLTSDVLDEATIEFSRGEHLQPGDSEIRTFPMQHPDEAGPELESRFVRADLFVLFGCFLFLASLLMPWYSETYNPVTENFSNPVRDPATGKLAKDPAADQHLCISDNPRPDPSGLCHRSIGPYQASKLNITPRVIAPLFLVPLLLFGLSERARKRWVGPSPGGLWWYPVSWGLLAVVVLAGVVKPRIASIVAIFSAITTMDLHQDRFSVAGPPAALSLSLGFYVALLSGIAIAGAVPLRARWPRPLALTNNNFARSTLVFACLAVPFAAACFVALYLLVIFMGWGKI